MSNFYRTHLVLTVQLLLLIQSIQTWENYNRKLQLKSSEGIGQISNASISANTSVPRIKTIMENLHTIGSNNADLLVKLVTMDETTDDTDIPTGGTTTNAPTVSTSSTTTPDITRTELPVQLSYTIATPDSIDLPPNVTSSAIYTESYPQIEKMIRDSLSNVSDEVNVIIYEAEIVQSIVQGKWKKLFVRSSSSYYLYIDAILQLPFECPSGSTCIDEIQTALEKTPLTELTLNTANGIFYTAVEKPTVQGLKPLNPQANYIGLIVGIVLAVLSILVLAVVASYVIVQKRKVLKLNKQFQGDFNLPIDQKYLKKKHNYGSKIFSYELDESNAFHWPFARLVKTWMGPQTSGFDIRMMEIVENRDKFNHFRQQIEIVESRQNQSAFQPAVDKETNAKERQKVLKRLDGLYKQVTNNRNVNIVRVWHGCNKQLLPQLLGEGFASLGQLDDGWFGKGIYFSSSAEYASRYCPQNENSCLIMCYVLVLNPFPVIHNDAPKHAKPRDFRFYGRGNHRTYQCHYIPVAPVSGEKSTMDFRPSPEGTDRAIYDELVVFESANILPQIVVHLKPSESLSPQIQLVAAPLNVPTSNESKHCNPNHPSSYRQRFDTSATEDQYEMDMINVSVGERNDNDDFNRQRQDDSRRQDDRRRQDAPRRQDALRRQDNSRRQDDRQWQYDRRDNSD
ncbi:unnamed protein product [Adineta steineri]|uniref:PARP catalytic domain-containing protein n=1 Tax=Adineta steineri TaxID=433720 RepID=A0A819FFT9_9BILA|nr:unnamed protein product [Adineta steineri]CAF1233267.1 unnamed protein product [Adineta steineri]CAF3679671.1 unnamed protein product [Adineta steineri]CAF3865331.1 unnamed protein product [Adineta steineri]